MDTLIMALLEYGVGNGGTGNDIGNIIGIPILIFGGLFILAILWIIWNAIQRGKDNEVHTDNE